MARLDELTDRAMVDHIFVSEHWAIPDAAIETDHVGGTGPSGHFSVSATIKQCIPPKD